MEGGERRGWGQRGKGWGGGSEDKEWGEAGSGAMVMLQSQEHTHSSVHSHTDGAPQGVMRPLESGG